MLFDGKRNRVSESDRFTFDPPHYRNEKDYYAGLRGRQVTIKEVVTVGRDPTVTLQSDDPVMAEFLREGSQTHIGNIYRMSYLTLID